MESISNAGRPFHEKRCPLRTNEFQPGPLFAIAMPIPCVSWEMLAAVLLKTRRSGYPLRPHSWGHHSSQRDKFHQH
jgi:hypothetical protein